MSQKHTAIEYNILRFCSGFDPRKKKLSADFVLLRQSEAERKKNDLSYSAIGLSSFFSLFLCVNRKWSEHTENNEDKKESKIEEKRKKIKNG